MIRVLVEAVKNIKIVTVEINIFVRMKSDKYDKIFQNNKEWIISQNKKDYKFFKNMYEKQNPDFLCIGCSDSRVPANTITGLDIGDIFVHRNIANIVSEDDENIMAVIQYAVENLKVKHIIVCGHYGCGGVKAAMENKTTGLLDNWLKNVRDVYKFNFDELKIINDDNKKYDRLVELNVIEQVKKVRNISFVQKSYSKNNIPLVHGWVYNMKNGELIDLEI